VERAVERDEKGGGEKNVSPRIIKSERSRAWGRIGDRGREARRWRPFLDPDCRSLSVPAALHLSVT